MHSMTGYGKATAGNDTIEITAELRSVNNRYLDLMIKLPREFSAFESLVRDRIKAQVQRGKISVFVNVNKSSSGNAAAMIDADKVRQTMAMLHEVRNITGLTEPITMRHLLTFSELFQMDLNVLDEGEVKNLLQTVLDQALEQFNGMRAEEGRNLAKDLSKRAELVKEYTEFIAVAGKKNMRSEFDKMVGNIENLIGQQKLDPNRLEQEMAVIADRVDITEECVRMRSHLDLFFNTLNKGGETGKKITFILQEMLREANTMNSKTTDINIAHRVIRVKEEIEKMREQAQNLE